MENKKSRLGRGLNDLIPTSGLDKLLPIENNSIGIPLMVEINKLDTNPDQPRQYFNDKELQSLSQSIKEKGIIEPIVVTKQNNTLDHFTIIAGERRLRAAKLANLEKVPVIIRESSNDPADALVLALLENICREDLNPIEEAQSFSRLEKDFGKTHQEIAQMTGKDRSTITNSMRLLKLPDYIQDDIRFARISSGHARAILSLKREDYLQRVRNEILTKNLSVRQTELLVKKLNRPVRAFDYQQSGFNDLAYYQSLAKNISNQLGGLQVTLNPMGKIKKMEISYQTNEELEWVLAKMGIKL